MKFYEDMPDVEAKDDLLVMVGDTTSPNQPKKITFAKIKAFVKQNWTINFGDLGKKPKINGVELKEADNTLADLKLQPAGTYISDTDLSTAIGKMIEKDTKETPLIAEAYNNVVLYARNEGEEGVEESGQVKVSLPALISEIKQDISFVYPTYKTLEGIQNGSNSQFKYRGTLIQETAELYIGAMIYPVNIGFTFEGDTIVITGAPVPKAEDIMRLKAIYLT